MIKSWRLGLPGERRLPIRRSLSLRLAGLVTLGLLPVGLIAVWQTTRLEENLAEVNALNLISLTAQIAEQERETIETAFGAATGLAAVIPELRQDPERCRSALRSFLEIADGRFSFAGFLPVDGEMSCSTVDHTVDLSGFERFRNLMETEKPNVVLSEHGAFSKQAVLIVNVPVRSDDEATFLGHLAISIPHYRLETPHRDVIGGRQMDLFTINAAGDILTASGDVETAAQRLPADMMLSSMVNGGARRFNAVNGLGQPRLFSVVPIAEGTVYAVGAWRPSRGAGAENPLMHFLGSPALFPILMWLVSFLLVIMAMEWMVVRHVRVLAGQMRRFAYNRELPQPPPEGLLPNELEIIEREFGELATRLLRDEAELMDAMHDKDVLLKEVHHRVKNNLQLISSIINMQVRRTGNKATAAALERVNGRVTSMAAVHRRLYQAENLGRVRADELLRDVVTPLTDLAQPGRDRPRLELRLDPVVLYPDQAVPAGLLAVEAVTNALKYLGPDAAGDSWLRVTLVDLHDGQVRLSIQSSVTPAGSEPVADAPDLERGDGTGLGSQLIRAFSRQLEAVESVEVGPDSYSLSLVFHAAPFEAGERPPAPEPAGT